MTTSTLTSKGQVTIPKEIRDRLSLRPGDILDFRFDETGKVVIEPLSDEPLGRLPGLLAHLAAAEPVAVDAMRRALRDRARDKTGSSR